MKQQQHEKRDPTERRGVIYARVSSKEQEQGYSIAAQLTLLRQYAGRQQVAVQHEFIEVETAKTSGRTAFAQMVTYLSKHPACQLILVEETDRLYRNFRDYVTIDELAIEIHLVKGKPGARAGFPLQRQVPTRHQSPRGQELHRQSSGGGPQGVVD